MLHKITASRTDKDGEEKSSTVAAIATKKIDDDKTAKLVIFSNELFAIIDIRID